MTLDTLEDSTESLGEWFLRNGRALSIASGVVAIAAVSIWFYMRSAEIKRLNADRGLSQAKQSLAAGNTALAATDLEKVAARYVGTPGGTVAAMLLAQLKFDQAKQEDGLKVLAPYLSARAAGASLADVWSLTGDGQISMGKAAEAAASYQKAADATDLAGGRAILLAKTARALMAAGKDPDARVIWEKLAADPAYAVVKNEAEIRLGELATKPAAK
jgi:predicted negative regulator of RcsB-dependent stress response